MSKFMSFVSPKKVNILYNLDNVKKVYTEDDIAGPSLCIITELGTEHYFYKTKESRDTMYAKIKAFMLGLSKEQPDEK